MRTRPHGAARRRARRPPAAPPSHRPAPLFCLPSRTLARATAPPPLGLHPLALTLAPAHPCPLPPAENKFVSTGFAEEIAKAANGKYYYLPNASDAAIAAATSSAMADAKAA